MDLDWTLSPVASRVLAFADDPRPAWLWTADGESPLWSNPAARAFSATRARPGTQGAEATPIRGQVARLLRLGAVGQPSLSRVQFSLGQRPVSATCTCTPLALPGLQNALLMVGLDPVLPMVDAGQATSPVPDEEPQTALNTGDIPIPAEPPVAHDPVPAGEEDGSQSSATGTTALDEPALDDGHRLSTLFDRLASDGHLFTPLADEEQAAPAPPVQAALEPGSPSPAEPPADIGPDGPGELAGAPGESVPSGYAVDPDLLRELARVRGQDLLERAQQPITPEERLPIAATVAEPVVVAAGEAAPGPPPSPEPDPLTPVAAAPEPAIGPEPDIVPPDPDTVERASRYNFDELSRILTDRVGANETGPAQQALTIEGIVRQAEADLAESSAPTGDATTALAQERENVPATTGGSSLVNLSGETLVLNRLPLGILVFRDQQVLFANRAITEMVGYGSVDELRRAGLAAVFPASDDGSQSAGPINHLVQRDGSLVPVTARLQSTSWQGKPALMLSASATEVRTSHEAAVRAFAEMLAETRGDGFFECNRAGVVTQVSDRAAALFNKPAHQLTGRPLARLVAPDELAALQDFLERPARFAETARPCLATRSAEVGLDVLLFAQGQSGVVSGYFGFLRPSEAASPVALAQGSVDPALLGRISRGVRRPLNTIIGFSDLIESAAFGPLDNPRYREYARDIKRAGHEIAALVDELDDYTRLKEGRYLPSPAEIDLGGLLESCVVKVRAQANAARVLVRSAISERLPRVTADRATLGQAALNLLASAIDQTPPGGSVVLSAHQDEDGGVGIHVRDSARGHHDLSDRFVVFRDGHGRDGEALGPVRSSVGLALTRSLLAVNGSRLSVDPAASAGTVFSITIPSTLVSPVLRAPAERAD